jgi:cytidylate kinase
MRCVAVGGEPATGKTTMMKEFFKLMKPTHNLKAGLLRGHLNNETGVSLMGIYNDAGTFLGTDRLSMAVNKDFQKYVRLQKRHIVFEGDRLFSKDNLALLDQYYELKIIVLSASEEEKHERHILRGDTQSETFLRGRATKIKNIRDAFGDRCDVRYMREPSHSIQLAEELLQWVTTGK